MRCAEYSFGAGSSLDRRLEARECAGENCVEFTGSRESRLPLDLHARDCLRRADDARSGREQFARGVAAAGAVGRWQVHGFPACGCAQLVHERCHCALRTRCVAGVHHSFHRRFGSASGTSGSVCACRGVCVGEVRQNTGPTAARGFEGQRARASRGLAVPQYACVCIANAGYARAACSCLPCNAAAFSQRFDSLT